MNISIFGLGYVGAVSAACLANDGHTVIGVDPNEIKVDLMNKGKTPIVEHKTEELIANAVACGKLTSVTSASVAVDATEISLVCVGTPSQVNGDLDLTYVQQVCEQIGLAIKEKDQFHTVVIRSTMLPGSMRNLVIPVLEQYSNKQAGQHFGVCNNPEFLREGTAVNDYYNPPKTVIGETDSRSGELLASIYEKFTAPMIRTDVETAEMVKYVDNVWHALKVGFANEIGNICKSLELDGHNVMDIFCQDTKLNLSPYYLKPGFAFGGSCLPKDIRALTYKARSLDLDLPILNSILPSNQLQVENAIRLVMTGSHRRIGILGISFKAGTDDLRESPLVELIERLLGKGYDIRIYDRNVRLASLTGANRDYIVNKIPHISRLMVDEMDDLIAHSETIIVGNSDELFEDIKSRVSKGQRIVDLIRIARSTPTPAGVEYEGICW